MPSMPFAPRLERNLIRLGELGKNASTSRMGIEEATQRIAPSSRRPQFGPGPGLERLVTCASAGAMSASARLQACLWFFTKAGTPKTKEVEEDERTLLAYSDPKAQNYVSVGGHARVVRDAANKKELWGKSLRVWFPGGPEGPDVALMKVTVDGAEVLGRAVLDLLHAYGYVKAVATGKPPKGGENEKVDFTESAR